MKRGEEGSSLESECVSCEHVGRVSLIITVKEDHHQFTEKSKSG